MGHEINSNQGSDLKTVDLSSYFLSAWKWILLRPEGSMRSLAVNGKRSKMIERRDMAMSHQLTTFQPCKNSAAIQLQQI